MSREEPGLRSEKGVEWGEGNSEGIATTEQTVYRDRRDPTALIGDEVEITVDGEPLEYWYGLLSVNGVETGHICDSCNRRIQ